MGKRASFTFRRVMFLFHIIALRQAAIADIARVYVRLYVSGQNITSSGGDNIFNNIMFCEQCAMYGPINNYAHT